MNFTKAFGTSFFQKTGYKYVVDCCQMSQLQLHLNIPGARLGRMVFHRELAIICKGC